MKRPKWLTQWRHSEAIAYADPLRAGRHPFQTYILAVCVISGAPAAFGFVGAGSVNEATPYWLSLAWGLSIFLGATTALIGSFWQGNYANGLTVERIGLAVVGAAALAYGVIIIATGGFDRLIPAAITFGFGASCIRRTRDIGRIIKSAITDLKAQA